MPVKILTNLLPFAAIRRLASSGLAISMFLFNFTICGFIQELESGDIISDWLMGCNGVFKFESRPNFISLKNRDIADYIGQMCWRTTTKAGDAERAA